ncbi:phage/plasmid primase, P4 family [Nitrososphaera sp.]|uniref:DNA primase family protein n=1 Tax=Nitrososphaera sp. TaxID=1971748 RepID=UPI002EDA6BF4
MMEPQLERTLSAVGDSLIATYHIRTIQDTGEMRFYSKNGYHEAGAERVIEQTVREQINRNISKHEMSEIIYYIQTCTYTDRSEFDNDPDWLHVNNGWLNINTREFVDHSPSKLSLSKMPHAYDPKAWPTANIRFLRDVLMQGDVKQVIKLLGTIILRKATYETGMIGVGEGRNGKSTLGMVIERFVGDELVTHTPPQDLSDDKFAKADLFGKWLNLVDDVDVDSIIKNTSYIKTLISGKTLKAQKKYGQPFEFANNAVFVMFANRIPDTRDKSYAWLRRWLVVEFRRVFEGEDNDVHLIDKLTTSQEMSGVLNLALVGVRCLKVEGGFHETDMEELRRKYVENTSRIKGFIKEECEVEIGNEEYAIESSVLREAYRKYCVTHGTRYFDERKLGEELKALGVIHRQKTVRGKGRPYHDIGLRLKAEQKDKRLHDYLGKTTNTLGTENDIVGEIVGSSPKQSSNLEVPS